MLRILGSIELLGHGRPVKIGGPREHVVLAALALRVKRVVSFDQLMEAVWHDDPPPTARSQVQSSISVLRKLFADLGRPGAIKTHPAGYLLDLTGDDLDSERFAGLVATAREQRTAEAAETLRTALELWRGPAAAGVQSDFVRRAASVLDDGRTTAIEEHLRLRLELGRHKELVGELRELLADQPLRERLYGFLMLALYRCGRQAEALEVWWRARRVLNDELGIEPHQELRDLERAILNRDPSLELTVPAPQPPPPVAEPDAASPRQLPTSIADFIGRDDQLAEIKRILLTARDADSARYAVPIIAISGRGGVGKSTLAQRAAQELGPHFPDGHIYADLRGLTEENPGPALLARFLRALGVPGSAVPEDVDERIEMYRSRLAGKRVLVLLDNVAGEDQVLPLLPGSPTCAVIVTSTARPVGVPGAHWIDVETFDDDTSAELLARIVGRPRLRAEPDAVAQLVTYCGGLPLALRIAGARLASRPQWRIVELTRRLKSEVRRLDELSHHGLEVRSSIALTHRSLPEQAQRLLRLCALVEAPDFPAWVAAVLLDTDVRTGEDALDRLVDVQLLDTKLCHDGQIRYGFHNLIRVYATERLMASETAQERDAASRRLLGAWLALVERAHLTQHGGDFGTLHGTAERRHLTEWDAASVIGDPMQWLEQERVSLLSAVRQAAAAGLDELCWDLALTLAGLFEFKGSFDDWREVAESAHDAAVRAGNQTGTAAMLYSLGSVHFAVKRLAVAEQFFASALEIFDAEAHLHGQALVLRASALIDHVRADFDRMLVKYTAALAALRAVDDPVGTAQVLTCIARFRIDEGDLGEANELLTEAMLLNKQAGYVRGEARVAAALAELYLATGRLAPARQALNDVLRVVRELGDRTGEAAVLCGLGIVRRREGHLDRAEATLAHALAVAERAGDWQVEGQVRYLLAEIAVTRADYPAAGGHADRARELFESLGMRLWLAKTFILLYEVHDDAGAEELVRGDLARARKLLTGIESRHAERLLGQVALATAAVEDDAPSERL